MGAELAPSSDGARVEELRELIAEIQARVRAKYQHGVAGERIALPDLLPLLHARDAAEAKVASIGKVNPRPPGLLNNFAQSVKRLVARALDWHVREQVEFNRAAMDCMEALLAALNENNRALAALASSISKLEGDLGQLRGLPGEWTSWRDDWQKRMTRQEVNTLKGMAELNAAFQYAVGEQHKAFELLQQKSALEIRTKLREDLDAIRTEYERLIYNELKVVRQRTQALAGYIPARDGAPAVSAEPHPAMPHDYGALRFAERFRGSEDHVRRVQEFYAPYFRGRSNVLDIGCGRGEFLSLMQDAGVRARGIDLSSESVQLCRARGFKAEQADLFEYLARIPAGSLDGIFSAQVIEHLVPERLPEFMRLAAAALDRDGVFVLETPNPECLAIFASHFYLDPTHTRPIPPALLVFHFEEAGFGRIEVHRLSPAVESMSSLASLPPEFREAFFGGLDYCVIGRRL